MDYLINLGKFLFEASENSFAFCGEMVENVNPITAVAESYPMYGEILFPITFREGKISFDISFDDIHQNTRAGIILNYQNLDAKLSYYQIGIRNPFSAYGIDYYNGTSWEYKTAGGQKESLVAQQNYSITVEVHGNNISLSVNGVKVIEYSQFINNFSGCCGIYICNAEKASIKNISIDAIKPTVFSIMKFAPDFDDLYNDVIKTQCENMGLESVRADECYTTNAIIQDIVTSIMNASVIIADVTMDNPNVFYELGYAHALQKPTILLADIDKRDKLPFDISGFRTIFYSNTIGGKKEIEQKLNKFLENIISSNVNLR